MLPSASGRRLVTLCLLASSASITEAACPGLKSAPEFVVRDATMRDSDTDTRDASVDEESVVDARANAKPRTVQILVSGVTNPYEIAIDDDSVYYTQEWDPTSTVRRVRKDGTRGEIVAPHDSGAGLNPFAADIVVAGDDVVWVNTTAVAGGIFARRRDGSGAVRRLKGPLDVPYRLASRGGDLFFVDRSFAPSTYALYRFPGDGGAATAIANYQVRVEGLATDSTAIYWTHSGPLASGKNGVRKHALAESDGADASVNLFVGRDNGELGGIAVGPLVVFWADRDGGRLLRTSKDGSETKEIASGLVDPVRLAYDDGFVYFTEQGHSKVTDGKISRVPAAGGEIELLASNVDRPWGIAVDATHVYWTAYGGGEVARVEKQAANADAINPVGAQR